ncbi:predicted protein [Naegleria gruberi]|uniref:Predicted protein n=1 Tax=Naegleria gruberi TaxID=5762 RepID=D2VZ49_NAEGR|nr:uncharacterized protein NAEGRDRAFT_53411 [Naegleria gruberi]EFC37929.1 predicted protein [Naegleria gruberi]|eukprot:XP_002670673.1 predicted protein [Naegleria gruberi strain NEG-M]
MMNFPHVHSTSLPTVKISTLIGGGSKIGDGMTGNALLRYPYGIALGLNSEILIADTFNQRIRKVSSSDVSTFAGVGTSSFSGDGALATQSEINFPYGVIVNSLGETFIADTSNHVIRKVSTNGKISTIAGTASSYGYSGDGGLATNALLNSPYGLALNSSSGEVIIVDTSNNVIRKVSSIGNITTIAGTGAAGYSGDNGQATNAKFNAPRAAFYSNGELFVADSRNHRIRKISNSGIVTTVAGTGTAGFNGDSILAKNAQLNYPSGISVNSNGEIFISDSVNNRIRKILTNGTIITIAGTGTVGLSGDGGLAVNAQLWLPSGIVVNSVGEIFISDSYNHRIRKISASGVISTFAGTSSFGEDVQASKSFVSPNGNPIIYGNNLLFTDNGKVRRVDLSTNVISTLSSVTPLGSAVSYYNNEVYVMYLGSYLSKIKSSLTAVAGTGAIGADSGDGLAITERLHNPNSIFISSNGDSYFSDSSNHKIRKLSNGYITTIAGTGTSGYSGDGSSATSAKLNNPKGVVVSSSGEIYFSDSENHRIRKISTGGIISTVAGSGESGFSGDGGLAISAKIHYPNGIAMNSNGELIFTDTRNNRIRKVSTSGYISTIAGNGTVAYKATFSGDNGLAINAQLFVPFAVAVNLTNNDIYIADSGNHRIRKVSSSSGIITTVAGTGTSGFSGDNGLATNAKLNFPFSISIGNSGEIYISDQYNQRVRKVAANGYISTIAGSGAIGFNGDGLAATSTCFNYPSGVSSNSNGDVFIIDSFNSRIRKLSSGKISTVAGGLGDGSSAVNSYLNSQSFAISSKSGEIFIADSNNHRIRKIATNGDISTVAGSGVAGFSGDGGLATSATLNNPSYVAVNSNGELLISDTNNHRIRKVSLNGIITTIAGNGTAGYNGEGNNASLYQLNYPSGLVVSSTGDLFIADSYNHRIRKLNVNGTISTSAGNGIAGLSGDGSLPTSAQLNFPTGLAVSSVGELYISDDSNNRIRKVSLTCSQGESLVNGLCEQTVTPTPSTSSGGSIPQPSKSITTPKTSGSKNVTPSKSQRVSEASATAISLVYLVLICIVLIGQLNLA